MQKLADLLAEGDLIDFGPLPAEINDLLQQGVALYYDDRPAADAVFRQARERDPTQLPTYYCLYKIHTYQRNLEAAKEAAESGLAEAARQTGLPADWRLWQPETLDWRQGAAVRFTLYTLKALAFIQLRRSEGAAAQEILAKLRRLDPGDAVGYTLVAEMADKLWPVTA